MKKVIKTNMSKHMSNEQLKVFLELWSLDGNGKLNGWLTDERLNLEAATKDPVLLKLRVLIDQQKGVENHMYGITTTRWRDFLEESLLLPPEKALAFQGALHKETQVGIHNMWQARNVARHALISHAQTWEISTFEDAISIWKKDLERRGRIPVEGAEARIRSWSRPKRLTWMHNKMNNQTSITEFMFPSQSSNTGVSVVAVGGVVQTVVPGSGLGLDTGSGSGLGLGRGQPSSGPTRKVQDRIDHRKQRTLDRYVKKAVDVPKVMDSSLGANLGRVVPGHLSWDPGATELRIRKQIGSGPLDESEIMEQNIEEDQVRIQEANSSDVTQSKAKVTRSITGAERSQIEANRQNALAIREEKRKLVETKEAENIAKRKKVHSAAAEKALEKSDHQKRTRDEHSKIQVVRSGDRKRKRKRVEPNKRVSLGEGKKKREREEPHINIPNAEGKRKKTDGKDGCNQLGSSTHKGIS